MRALFERHRERLSGANPREPSFFYRLRALAGVRPENFLILHSSFLLLLLSVFPFSLKLEYLG